MRQCVHHSRRTRDPPDGAPSANGLESMGSQLHQGHPSMRQRQDYSSPSTREPPDTCPTPARHLAETVYQYVNLFTCLCLFYLAYMLSYLQLVPGNFPVLCTSPNCNFRPTSMVIPPDIVFQETGSNLTEDVIPANESLYRCRMPTDGGCPLVFTSYFMLR